MVFKIATIKDTFWTTSQGQLLRQSNILSTNSCFKNATSSHEMSHAKIWMFHTTRKLCSGKILPINRSKTWSMWMFLRDTKRLFFLTTHYRSLGANIRIPAKLNRRITYSLIAMLEYFENVLGAPVHQIHRFGIYETGLKGWRSGYHVEINMWKPRFDPKIPPKWHRMATQAWQHLNLNGPTTLRTIVATASMPCKWNHCWEGWSELLLLQVMSTQIHPQIRTFKWEA